VRPRLRTWVLAAGLAAALAAAGWVGGEERAASVEPALEERAPPRAERPRLTPAAATLDLAKLAEPRLAEAASDMFQTQTWTPPPAPERRRPPAAPEPPPLPFTFFGRMSEGPQTTVFLSRNEEIFTVRAGDTIAGTWRVDEVNDAAIVLTYLPLSRRQVLDIGAIN